MIFGDYIIIFTSVLACISVLALSLKQRENAGLKKRNKELEDVFGTVSALDYRYAPNIKRAVELIDTAGEGDR